MATTTLPITGEPAADDLLARDPFALLVGMLLDQQVPMEWAFKGPYTLKERLGGSLDAATIAAMSPEDVEEIFKQKPALHRYPGSMGKRTHALATFLVEHYDGKAESVWSDAASGDELLARLRELPGYGDEKARIFLALLAKRFGVTPRGWEQAASPFSDTTKRSVADIDSREALQEVREFKQMMKKKGKGKAD
jgi:uncharacterized HhH-GPD family protein